MNFIENILREAKELNYEDNLFKMFSLLSSGENWVKICESTFGYEKWNITYDKILVPLSNNNKIKKFDKIDWALALGYFIKNTNLNITSLDSEITCYRGFANKQWNVERLNEKGFLSFSTDKKIANTFTDSTYTSGNFNTQRKFEGYIAEVNVKIKDVFLFNSVGYEDEVILRTPITNYTITKNK